MKISSLLAPSISCRTASRSAPANATFPSQHRLQQSCASSESAGDCTRHGPGGRVLPFLHIFAALGPHDSVTSSLKRFHTSSSSEISQTWLQLRMHASLALPCSRFNTSSAPASMPALTSAFDFPLKLKREQPHVHVAPFLPPDTRILHLSISLPYIAEHQLGNPTRPSCRTATSRSDMTQPRRSLRYRIRHQATVWWRRLYIGGKRL